MADILSPSPTLSPKPSFSTSHDRSIAVLRRPRSRSYRLSPSSSQAFHSHVSSPATSIHHHTPTSAPKRPIEVLERKSTTSDTGTQYSPPDLPPTARTSRSMSATSISGAPLKTPVKDESKDAEGDNVLEISAAHGPPPPEPVLRQDPEPHTPPGGSSGSAPMSGTTSDDAVETESPTKRARGETAVKVMPLDYMKCDIRDIGIVIADMLMELIRINDPLPFKNAQLTRYHSRYVCFIAPFIYLC